jgi:hypothetical protein
MLPWARRKVLLEWTHRLTYQSYGGSGYGFSRSEVLAMPCDEIEWFMKRGEKADKDTAEAIEKARGGKG